MFRFFVVRFSVSEQDSAYVTKEMPLFMMAEAIRLARIYEGPTEAHRMAVARRTLARFPG